MNEKEFYIAMCQCCLIADAMKTCPVCRFNIGLIKRGESAPAAIPIQLMIFAQTGR